MKQGWEIKKLGDVCDIQGGATPKRTESLYWEGGTYPWFTIEDIREQGHIIADTKQKITKVAWDRLRVFPKDTIMLCCTASIGEYAITHIPLTSNQQFNGLMINDKSYLSPMYLMHYCATLKDKLAMLSGKATIDFVSAEKVRQIPIPIPSLAEQERIVEVLDMEFERIDALKANAEQNLQYAKDLFQAALRKELQPKEGWETTQLGNVCELKQGLAINAKTKYLLVKKSKLPLLRIKDLKEGTREIFVNESECPQNCRAYPDDVIYTRTGTLGLVFTGVYGVMHNNCFKIVVDKEKIEKYFLIHYLQQDEFRNNIIKLASKAAQPDITHTLFKGQLFSYPSLSEQEQIVARLDKLNERCKALEENYRKTIALCDDMKQALLRKAFNGEL